MIRGMVHKVEVLEGVYEDELKDKEKRKRKAKIRNN